MDVRERFREDRDKNMHKYMYKYLTEIVIQRQRRSIYTGMLFDFDRKENKKKKHNIII